MREPGCSLDKNCALFFPRGHFTFYVIPSSAILRDVFIVQFKLHMIKIGRVHHQTTKSRAD